MNDNYIDRYIDEDGFSKEVTVFGYFGETTEEKCNTDYLIDKLIKEQKLNTDYYRGIKNTIIAMTNYFLEVNHPIEDNDFDQFKEWVDKILDKLDINKVEFMFHVKRLYENYKETKK
jgi:hypothetical protein